MKIDRKSYLCRVNWINKKKTPTGDENIDLSALLKVVVI